VLNNFHFFTLKLIYKWHCEAVREGDLSWITTEYDVSDFSGSDNDPKVVVLSNLGAYLFVQCWKTKSKCQENMYTWGHFAEWTSSKVWWYMEVGTWCLPFCTWCRSWSTSQKRWSLGCAEIKRIKISVLNEARILTVVAYIPQCTE